MISALILVPLFAGIAALILRNNLWRRALLLITAIFHTGMTLSAWVVKPAPSLEGWLAFDAIGLLFLSITSLLFFFCTLYAINYLKNEPPVNHEDFEERVFFSNAPEARFTGCLLLFLATMTLVPLSQHFGILWVSIEATTLASAPLIFFHRHHRSLEATWKYLLVCSVGIAVALLGNFSLAVAASMEKGNHISMVIGEMIKDAPHLHIPWLKAAFICFLVGYGTKMGLAPMHTWLPDAHSESPSVVSALLSGALLNCAFVGILRAYQICSAAGIAQFSQSLLIGFGLFSMLVATVFIIGQTDYKRLLAYSSIEHMGILSLGVGIGGSARFGAILHAINHSFTKGMLFLLAGNILSFYKTKDCGRVKGISRILPQSGALWIAGLFAITGSPPFGSFISEFLILKGAIESGHFIAASAYLLFLALIFIGMATVMMPMVQGVTSEEIKNLKPGKETFLSIMPPVALGIIMVVLGIYIPSFLSHAVEQASNMLGGF